MTNVRFTLKTFLNLRIWDNFCIFLWFTSLALQGKQRRLPSLHGQNERAFRQNWSGVISFNFVHSEIEKYFNKKSTALGCRLSLLTYRHDSMDLKRLRIFTKHLRAYFKLLWSHRLFILSVLFRLLVLSHVNLSVQKWRKNLKKLF